MAARQSPEATRRVTRRDVAGSSIAADCRGVQRLNVAYILSKQSQRKARHSVADRPRRRRDGSDYAGCRPPGEAGTVRHRGSLVFGCPAALPMPPACARANEVEHEPKSRVRGDAEYCRSHPENGFPEETNASFNDWLMLPEACVGKAGVARGRRRVGPSNADRRRARNLRFTTTSTRPEQCRQVLRHEAQSSANTDHS